MASTVRIGTQVTGVAKAEGDLDRLRNKFTKLQTMGAKGFATGVGAAATLRGISLAETAVLGVTSAVFDAIKAGSDLNETMSKSGVVFGRSAQDISTWGDTAADALGLSKKNAVEAAASFGNLFKGLGETDQASASMSKRLVVLASDLASFNNLDPTEALDKLRSGLAGEAEPLRRLGVFLSEAKVKAKAMELGLVGANGELSEGAKVVARYNLILDETTTAQGDFARTSGEVANQSRILSANMEDLSAKVGTKLTPAFQTGQRAILGLADAAETGGDAVSDFLNFLAGPTSLDALTGAAGDAEDAIGALAYGTNEAQWAIDRDLGRVSASAKDMAGWVDRAADRVTKSFDDMVDALSDSVSDLIDDVYDPAINAAELAANKHEQAELRKVMASKSATAEEKRDARDRLLSLSKSADETRLALLEAGELTAADTDEWLGKLQKRYDKATGKARADIAALMAKIRELAALETAGIAISVSTGLNGGPRGAGKKQARGGPTGSGGRTLVGEEGPEIVDMPAGAFVHDAQSSRAMMGNTYNLNVMGRLNVDDAMSAVRAMRRLESVALTPNTNGQR